MNLLDILKKIISSQGMFSSQQKETLLANIPIAIDNSYDNYSKLPQEEKDRHCVELAQDLGCQSSDVLICSNYIYFHANGKPRQVS